MPSRVQPRPTVAVVADRGRRRPWRQQHAELAERFAVALNSVRSYVLLVRIKGTPVPPVHSKRPVVKMDKAALDDLRRLVDEKNDWSLAQLAELLVARGHMRMGLTTIERGLAHLGITRRNASCERARVGFEGAMNGEIFTAYIRARVAPTLSPNHESRDDLRVGIERDMPLWPSKPRAPVLCLWRVCGSTVEITRSGATRRSMRERPSPSTRGLVRQPPRAASLFSSSAASVHAADEPRLAGDEHLFR